MRCANCQTENEEGRSTCSNCGTPFTAYSGQITGSASEAALDKLARLRHRPAVVPIMAGFSILVALFGPLRSALAAIVSRPTTSSDLSNYAGSAFGAVGLFLNLLIMIPVGCAILLAAWGAMTQRTWAWWANLAVITLLTIGSFTGSLGGTFMRLTVLVICALLACQWLSRDAREWFGVA